MNNLQLPIKDDGQERPTAKDKSLDRREWFGKIACGAAYGTVAVVGGLLLYPHLTGRRPGDPQCRLQHECSQCSKRGGCSLFRGKR